MFSIHVYHAIFVSCKSLNKGFVFIWSNILFTLYSNVFFLCNHCVINLRKWYHSPGSLSAIKNVAIWPRAKSFFFFCPLSVSGKILCILHMINFSSYYAIFVLGTICSWTDVWYDWCSEIFGLNIFLWNRAGWIFFNQT